MSFLKNMIEIMVPWKSFEISKDEKIEEKEAAKKEPFVEFPLQVSKLRRNMLICGVLCVAQTVNAVTGTPKFANLDINLTKTWLNVGLLAISMYCFFYFNSQAWAFADKWRLRRTGIPDSEMYSNVNMFGGNQSENITQSTAWDIIAAIKENIEIAEKQLREKENIDDYCKSIDTQLKKMETPLNNFETNFWDSQSKRWTHFVFFEFHGPNYFCFGAILALLGRIVYDLFLCCPAVK